MEYQGGIAYDKCPNCGGRAEAEGVHNGVGYVYPPLYCPSCGWSEQCVLWDTERCSKACEQYGYCSKLTEKSNT